MTVCHNRVGRNMFGTGGRFTNGDIVRLGFNRVGPAGMPNDTFTDEGSGRSKWAVTSAQATVQNVTSDATSGATPKEGLGMLGMTTGGGGFSTPHGANNCLTSGGAFIGFWHWMTNNVSRDVLGITGSLGTAAGDVYWFGTASNGRPLMVVSNGTTRQVIVPASGAVGTGQWNYWSGDWDGSTWSLAINGVSVATAALTGTMNFIAGQNLAVGVSGGQTAPGNGSTWDMLQIRRRSMFGTATFTPPTRFLA